MSKHCHGRASIIMQSCQEPLLSAVANAGHNFAAQKKHAALALSRMSYNTLAAATQGLFNGGDPGRHMQRKQAFYTADGHTASRQQSM